MRYVLEFWLHIYKLYLFSNAFMHDAQFLQSNRRWNSKRRYMPCFPIIVPDYNSFPVSFNIFLICIFQNIPYLKPRSNLYRGVQILSVRCNSVCSLIVYSSSEHLYSKYLLKYQRVRRMRGINWVTAKCKILSLKEILKELRTAKMIFFSSSSKKWNTTNLVCHTKHRLGVRGCSTSALF